ncbi:MAG: WG repeat-containing protein [Flavobacteriales bacterium]|nr:WG repeat-containing protein [Flavobacteriales bacterium]
MQKVIFLLGFLSLTISSFSQSQYEKEFFYINEKGQEQFSIWAKSVYDFSNGRAKVRKYVIEGNKAFYRYGFIDTKGNLAVQCKYDKANPYHTTATWVRIDGEEQYRLIDHNGNDLGARSEKSGFFFEGLSKFYKGGKLGYVDSLGKVIIEANYIGAQNFSEGMVCLCPYDATEEVYGFFDKKGEMVIPFQFAQAGFTSFNGGYARVKYKGKSCIIDSSGAVVLTSKYRSLTGLSEGLISVAFGPNRTQHGFINLKDEVVIKGIYYRVNQFKKGYSVVENTDRKQGLIDKTGQEVFKCENELLIHYEEDGMVMIKNGDTPKYYHLDGTPFTTANVSRIIGSDGNSDLLAYRDAESGKWGYLNHKGEIVIEAKYKKVGPFSADGLAWIEK